MDPHLLSVDNAVNLSYVKELKKHKTKFCQMDIDKLIINLQSVVLHGNSDRVLFRDLNFGLSAGQIAIVTGPTGTGKSSIVELIVGLKKPNAGTVTVFGRRVDRPNERTLKNIRKRIGGVGGIFHPLPQRTVYENMMYPLIFRGIYGSDKKSRVEQTLRRFDLLSKKDDKAGRLSRGEEILLLLGRAIVADQPLLLIDEPLAGLDAERTKMVREVLNRLAIAGHTMLVLTSGQTELEIQGADRFTITEEAIK